MRMHIQSLVYGLLASFCTTGTTGTGRGIGAVELSPTAAVDIGFPATSTAGPFAVFTVSGAANEASDVDANGVD